MFNPFMPNPGGNPFEEAVKRFTPSLGQIAMAPIEALQAPGNLVRGGIGKAAQAVDAVVPWSGHSLQQLEPQRAFDEALYRGVQVAGGSNPGTGVLNAIPKPFAQFLTAQLFDPVNAVGLGIPGKALAAGKLAKAGLNMDELASAAAQLGKTPEAFLSELAPQSGRLTRSLELLDSFEGGTQRLLSEAFGLIPKAAGAVGRAVPLHREIIGDVAPDLTASVRESENLTDWATSLSKRGYLKQFEGSLQDALAQYKSLGGDFAEIDPSLLPDDLAAIFTQQVQAGFGHHVRGLSNEREKLEKMIQGIWSSRKQADFPADQFAQAGADPLSRYTAVFDDLGIPHGEVKSTVDLLEAAKTHVSDQDWNTFDRMVRAYPAGDILKDNPLDLVLDRVVRDRAKMLGMTEPTGVSKAWQTGTALFNEQALQSISYLLTNALGGTFMGSLEGVNPFKVARNLTDNFGAAARGEPVFTSGTRNLAQALGLVGEDGTPLLPHSVSAAGAGMLNDANPTRLYTGKGLTASQEIGAPKLAIGGAALGGASGFAGSPDDASFGETALNTLGGMAAGGAIGGAMPTMSKYLLQRLSRGMEDVMRQSAWELGTRNQILSSSDQLDQIVREAYTNGFPVPQPTPGIDIASTPAGQLVNLLRQRGIEPPTLATGVTASGAPKLEPDWRLIEAIKQHAASGGTVRNPNGPGAQWLQGLLDAANPIQGPAPVPLLDVEDFLKAVGATDNLFSPSDLTDALRNMGGLGDDAAQAAGKAWQNVIHGASQSGAGLSDTIHFDYSDLNNLESLVRQMVPFSTWSMKAFPFFARHIAEHPAILTSALELQRQSSEMRDEQGLTSRVQGSLPMGGGADALWSVLLGRNVDTYTNPLRGLVPFSDTFKSIEDLDQMDNPVAAAYKLLTAFGPSAHPALEFIARTSGILGQDTPARGLSRHAGPVQGLTALLGANRGRGINPEAALTEGEERLREGLSGREVTDLAQTAAERRIDELALATTGQTITSGDPRVVPYLQAKTQHRGPLWDQAMKDVSRERGLRSLVGYVSNQASPSAIVSEEEAQIRQARASLTVPQDLSQQIRQMAQTAPGEKVQGETYRSVQQIAQSVPPNSGIRPEDIQTVLAMPVAANVQWLFSAIYEYERRQNPAVSAYSGAGSPEQRNLQNLLTEYRNIAASVPELRGLPPEQIEAISSLVESRKNLPAGMRPQNSIVGRYASLLGQGQEKFRQANPVLDEYLSWLAQNQGRGSVEEFVKIRAGS
jgi:hypothetical protein